MYTQTNYTRLIMSYIASESHAGTHASCCTCACTYICMYDLRSSHELCRTNSYYFVHALNLLFLSKGPTLQNSVNIFMKEMVKCGTCTRPICTCWSLTISIHNMHYTSIQCSDTCTIMLKSNSHVRMNHDQFSIMLQFILYISKSHMYESVHI